jgi:hypothetical protein
MGWVIIFQHQFKGGLQIFVQLLRGGPPKVQTRTKYMIFPAHYFMTGPLIICSTIFVLSTHESTLSTQYLTLTSSIYLPKANRFDGRKSLDITTAFVPEF